MPLFARAGAIIPMQDECNFVTHGEKLEHIELLVYPGGKGEYTLYEDDGVTLDYKNGVFATTKICAGEDENGLFVCVDKPQGDVSVLPQKRAIKVRFIGKSEVDYTPSCSCACLSKDGDDLLVKFEMDTAKGCAFALEK